MGTVTPLNVRSAQALAELAREPVYRTLSQEARQAYASLKGRMNALDRAFSGAFASAAAVAEIGRQCDEIRLDAMRVARLSR